MNIDRAVIMAAGAGRRMNSGYSKPMTNVGSKKLIQYGIDALLRCNIKSIIIIYSEFSQDVLELGNIYEGITFIKQENVDGSLSTFILAGKICCTPCLILDCDLILFSQELSEMLRSTRDRGDAYGYFAVVTDPWPDSPRYIRLSSDRIINFRKDGVEDGYAGGMIYLWSEFPLQEAMIFSTHSKSLSQFFDYLVKEKDIYAMYIDHLWDVDTMDEVRNAEALLEEKYEDRV